MASNDLRRPMLAPEEYSIRLKADENLAHVKNEACPAGTDASQESCCCARCGCFGMAMRRIDEYKESSRRHRRTVFSDEDWVKYRSSERIFANLRTTFSSLLIQGIWLEIGAVTFSAVLVYAFNLAVSHGLFEPLLTEDTIISLPALPFQLSSPALGLLLVFRTNTVYLRWNMARMNWDNILNHCNNLARQGMAYIKVPSEKQEFIRRIMALANIFQVHFRHETEQEAKLQARLEALLGPSDAQRVMSSHVRPVQAMTDLSRIVRRTPGLDGSTRSRFDMQIDELNRAFIACESLRRSPVPLVYTRHTERFLGLWTLLIPMALAKELGGGFTIVPMSAAVALFLFGIEEIGVQLEEPLSVLPLEDWVSRIERDTRQMLRHEVAFPDSDPVLGPHAAADI